MNRRLFLKGAATAAAAVPLTAFMQRAEAWPGPNPRRSDTAGYGPLSPALDQTTGLPRSTSNESASRIPTASRRRCQAISSGRRDAQRAATFARLEGCWFGNERRIYIVNVQSPGITFAITGPWQTGAL